MLLHSIFTLLRGGSVDPIDVMVQIFATLMVIFLVMPIHEFAHGWMAYKLGDPTAKYAGRLTLNPLASIDPMGAAAILLVGFGWGKPVPVNSLYFRKRRQGIALTALAGPVSNLLTALAASFLSQLVLYITYWTGSIEAFANGNVVYYVYLFLQYFISISVSLAVFNLIPIPPLDGSKVLMSFLPDRANFWFMKNQNILMPALLVLLYLDILDKPISLVSSLLVGLIDIVTDLPFYLISLLLGL